MSSAEAITIPLSPENATYKNTTRPTSTYQACIWSEHFENYYSAPNFMKIDTKTQQEHEQLKEEVGGMLDDATMNPSKILFLIDAVQRLGVDYHFETEIDNSLEKIYAAGVDRVEPNLFTLALWFRLLRQQGIKAPSEIFKKFMDQNGKFKESLADDASGLLNLYEAAHLALPGEDILDEAIDFTTSHLQSMIAKASPLLAEQIARALNRPIRKGIPRIEARHYISLLSRDNTFASSYANLLRFAKIDFNMVQAFHLKELSGITEWWKKIDFTTKAPFARDRLVECYFWIVGVYFEPKYSFARTFVVKIIATTSILDDIYDNYGTYEELVFLTECIERWDIGMVHQLPEFMKAAYEAILNVFSEMEEEVAKEERSYAIDYGEKAFKRAMKAYLHEAMWRQKGYIPTIEEYMDVALTSTNYPMLITNSFVGMGEFATKETFEWISNDPKMLKACTIICRLMDDIVSHEFEQKRVHVASAVECFLKQYGIPEEEIVKDFRKEIADAWKSINEEFIKPTIVPHSVLTRILNFARVMDVLYKDSDAYTHPDLMKDYVALLLVDHVDI